MADYVFNIAKGTVNQRVADGNTIAMLVLKAEDSQAVLEDLDDIAAVLGNGSTTEADFDNYARTTLVNSAKTTDDTGDEAFSDSDDVTFTAAGGTTDNTTTGVVIYDEGGGTDATRIPLVHLDAAFTTDGNDVTIQFGATGWFGAT